MSDSLKKPKNRSILFCLLVLTLSVSLTSRAASAEDVPILQQDPYDTIRLDASNGHKELKVEPLKFPDRIIPSSPKPTDKIEVLLLDDTDKAGSIEWRSIEKIILFEDRVLAKANELIAAEKLDEAYDYYKYVFEKSPHLANLKESYNNYLYAEAKLSHRNQKYDEALAVLRQLYASNPMFQSLDKALGVETDKLVEQYIAQNRYPAARTLIQDLVKAYPGHPVAAAWNDRIHKQAEGYLREGKTAAEKGDWIKASEQSRLLAALESTLPEAKELAQQIHEKFPRIVVGVMSASQTGGENMLADWSLRRDRRLFYRTLTEYLGPGTDGGQYVCPVGKYSLSSESLGRRLLFQIKPDIRWAVGDATLTAYDVSRRLCVMADPADPAFCEDWAEIFKGVTVKGASEVEIELRRMHVRPEALMQTILMPYGGSSVLSDPPQTNGPFMFSVPAKKAVAEAMPGDSQADTAKGEPGKWTIPPVSTIFTEAIFHSNPQYFAAKPAQPKELIERHYSVGINAIHALKAGDIQILDRIAPWNLPLIKNDPKITIGKYNIPLVHCLVPNFRRPLVMSRTFRRALAYGLHREAILTQLIGKEPIEGCRVISGPFSAGISSDDPLNYAYDERIEPRPCDPRMAMALSGVSLKEYIESEKKKGRDVKKLPRLILAYPEDEIAAEACKSIRYQLNLVHIEVDLKPLKGPVPNRVPDDVDMLYAELAMGEPMTDAGRLFGENGLAGGGSPYIALAVKQLEQANDWAKIRDQFRRLHRIAFDDVAILPLWQLVDFYAYRKGNRGIGEKPFTLYQNIEQWQPAFYFPEGE
jgi:ABC-type transport system substrate-binding protein